MQFSVIEFDGDTFRVLLTYLHTGSCPLNCLTIPGLICSAEHYDLPELLQACFHHAKQFIRVSVVSAGSTAGMGSREGVGGNRRLSSSLFMSPIDGSAKANLFFAASLL